MLIELVTLAFTVLSMVSSQGLVYSELLPPPQTTPKTQEAKLVTRIAIAESSTVLAAETISFSENITPDPTIAPTITPTATTSPKPTNTPTLKPSPSLTSTATPTPSPAQTPPPTEPPKPTSAPVVDLELLFAKYSDEYHIDKELLKRIAKCESGFNTQAKNLGYLGLYQFAESSWDTVRSTMGLPTDPALRTNAEEAIKTAAYMLSKGQHNAWPSCK